MIIETSVFCWEYIMTTIVIGVALIVVVGGFGFIFALQRRAYLEAKSNYEIRQARPQ